jgi:hypothetical protein
VHHFFNKCIPRVAALALSCPLAGLCATILAKKVVLAFDIDPIAASSGCGLKHI